MSLSAMMPVLAQAAWRSARFAKPPEALFLLVAAARAAAILSIFSASRLLLPAVAAVVGLVLAAAEGRCGAVPRAAAG